MKINLHQNGWTVLVSDVDLKNISQQQVNLLGKYLLTNTLVVIKNQNLSPEDQIDICAKFGKVECHDDKEFNEAFLLKEGKGYIKRVTGELDEHGRPGMFGHKEELEWHCNRVSDPDRMPVVWLYAAQGTKGSRTSYVNNVWSYNDLSESDKEIFENYHLNVGNVQQFIKYYRGNDYEPRDITEYRPKLIHRNKAGTVGLFFSHNQTHFIQELDHQEGRNLIERLKNHILNEKYQYHHDWEDGDVVVADQWLGIHKRWEFEHMERRVLHRLAFDYSNVNLNNLP